MRKTSFDKKYLFEELDRLATEISERVNLTMIGGGGLIFYGLKDATKDLDVVLENSEETSVLVDSLKNLGYRPLSLVEISRPYRKMEAHNLENRDGFRWDIFDRLVCNRLALSNEMKSRGTDFYNKGPLKVMLASKEDIFLFKGITERETDLDDMRLLAESGLDWEIIEQECHNQSVSSGILWENALYQRLIDLKDKHGIEAPIEKSIRTTLEEKLNEITLTDAIKQGNRTIRTISQAIEEPEYFVRKSLKKMADKGLIEIDRSHRPYRFHLIYMR